MDHHPSASRDPRESILFRLCTLANQDEDDMSEASHRLQRLCDLGCILRDIRKCSIDTDTATEPMTVDIGRELTKCMRQSESMRIMRHAELVANVYDTRAGLSEDGAHFSIICECYFVLDTTMGYLVPPVDSPLPPMANVLGDAAPVESMGVTDIYMVLSSLHRHRRHIQLVGTDLLFIRRLYHRIGYLLTTWHVDMDLPGSEKGVPDLSRPTNPREEAPSKPKTASGRSRSDVNAMLSTIRTADYNPDHAEINDDSDTEFDRSAQDNVLYPDIEGYSTGYDSTDDDEDDDEAPDLMQRFAADPRDEAIVRMGSSLAGLQLGILEEMSVRETAVERTFDEAHCTTGARIEEWALVALRSWDNIPARVVKTYTHRSVAPDETAFTAAFGGRVAVERAAPCTTVQNETLAILDYNALLMLPMSARIGTMCDAREITLLYLFHYTCDTSTGDYPSCDFLRDHLILDARSEGDRRLGIPDRWVVVELQTGWIVVHPYTHSRRDTPESEPVRVNSEIMDLDSALGLFYDAYYEGCDPFSLHSIPCDL